MTMPDAEWAALLARGKAKATARKAWITEHGEVPIEIRNWGPHKLTLRVTPSSKVRGKWQATWFDERGPSHDTQRDTYEKILEEIGFGPDDAAGEITIGRVRKNPGRQGDLFSFAPPEKAGAPAPRPSSPLPAVPPPPPSAPTPAASPVAILRPDIDGRTLALLRHRVEELDRRARRLKLGEVTLKVDAKRRVETKRGERIAVVFEDRFDVTITAPPVPIRRAGYALVAIAKSPVEGEDVNAFEGSRIISVVDRGLVEKHKIDLGGLRGGKLACAHCKAVRKRLTVAAVLHEPTGRLLVLGLDCLTYYIPADVNSVELLADVLAVEHIASADDDEGEGGAGGAREADAVALQSILVLAADEMRRNAFVPASAVGKLPTRHVIADLLWNKSARGVEARKELKARLEEPAYLASIEAEVADVRRWVSALRGDGSEYAANLQAVFAVDIVSSRTLGLAVSAVAVAKRDREQLERAAAKKASGEAKHVGTVGKRENFGRGKVVAVQVTEGGQYGPSWRVGIVLEGGADLVWWSSTNPGALTKFDDGERLAEIAVGDIVEVTASVKKHGEFKGMPQTTITRAKLKKIVGAEKNPQLDMFGDDPPAKRAAPSRPRPTPAASAAPASPENRDAITKILDAFETADRFGGGAVEPVQRGDYWVSMTKSGTTVGNRYPTREAWQAAYESYIKSKRDDFASHLAKMTPIELKSQAEYWLAPKPVPAPRPTKATKATKPAAAPASLQVELKRLKARSFKTRSDEINIKRLEARIAADPAKWKVGDGVGWRVSGDQINRGFRIVESRPGTKEVVIRQVADTGLTTTGGDADRLEDQVVHVADLVRDKKFQKNPPRLTREPAKAIQFGSRAEASAAAKSIGWKAKDATRIDVMGFALWTISDDHMNFVTRESFAEAVAERRASKNPRPRFGEGWTREKATDTARRELEALPPEYQEIALRRAIGKPTVVWHMASMSDLERIYGAARGQSLIYFENRPGVPLSGQVFRPRLPAKRGPAEAAKVAGKKIRKAFCPPAGHCAPRIPAIRTGAPVPARAAPPARPRAELQPIFDAHGRKYTYRVERVPLEQIVASHLDTGAPDPRARPEFQARNFSIRRAREIGASIDPDRLAPEGQTPTIGAPVVWRDPAATGLLHVLAGNHRLVGMRLSGKFGKTVAVRVLQGGLDDAKRLAAASQQSDAAPETLVERSRATARGLGLSIEDLPRNLGTEPVTRDNVNAFLQRNAAFAAKILRPKEEVSPEDAAARVAQALIGLLPPSTQEVLGAVGLKAEQAIAAAAPVMLYLHRAAKAGEVFPVFDVLPSFDRAAQAFRRFAGKGKSAAAIVKELTFAAEQPALFGGADAALEIDQGDAGFILGLASLEGRASPGEAVAEAFAALLAQAREHNPRQTALFAGAIEVDRLDVVRTLFGAKIADQAKKFRPAKALAVAANPRGPAFKVGAIAIMTRSLRPFFLGETVKVVEVRKLGRGKAAEIRYRVARASGATGWVYEADLDPVGLFAGNPPARSAAPNPAGGGLQRQYTIPVSAIPGHVIGRAQAIAGAERAHGHAPKSVRVFEYDDGRPELTERALFALGDAQVTINVTEGEDGREVRIKPLKIGSVYAVKAGSRSSKAGNQYIHSHRDEGGSPPLQAYDPVRKLLMQPGGTYDVDGKWIRR